MPSSDVLGLNDVLYVFGLTKNLLSVSAMADLQCQGLARRMCEGGIYKLVVYPRKHDSLMHDGDKLCKLWHKRSGHLHYRAFQLLKNMMQGLPDLKIENTRVCEARALRKHAKKQ